MGKKENAFIPSLKLTKEYWDFYDQQIPADEMDITREQIINGVQFMGEFIKATEEDMQKTEQKILGSYLMSSIISYTQSKSEQTKGDCKGLVVKLTENDSFNEEFLKRYKNYFGIEKLDVPKFYQALHKEFLEYAKKNPEKFYYAKTRVNEDNEIEFHDFKYEKFPDLDKLLEGRWKTYE